MTQKSLSQKLIKLTKMTSVRVGSATSEPFRIMCGLKQGEAMSPVLFNFTLEKTVREADTGMQMFSVDPPWFLMTFADVNDIIAQSIVVLREQFV